jgi:trimeric autotransporter adhesin
MPRGFHIASAWVDIHAEDAGLRQQVERMIKKAVAGKKIEIPVKINDKNLRQELTRAVKKATTGQGVAVPVKIDGKGLRRELQNAIKTAAAGNKKVLVPVGISDRGLRTEIRKALLKAASGERIRIPIGVSDRGLRGEIRRALMKAASGERIEVPVKIDVDARQVKKAVKDASDDAEATIRPNVDFQHLRQQMMSAIRRLNVNEDVMVNTHIDGDMLRNQIQSEVARLRDKFRVRIAADVDTDTFAARIKEAARNVPGDIDIDLNPRINALKARAEAGRAFANLQAKITFNGDLDTAMLNAQIAAAVGKLNLMHRDLRFRAYVDVDRQRLMNSMNQIQSLLGENGGHWKRWAAIVAASALLGPPALAILDNALRKSSASIAVVIPMVTGLAVAVSTLMIGMQGLGEVISGVFNYEKLGDKALSDFEITLDGLSPSARRFADALMDVKDQFTDLRKSVQGILFNDMDITLRRFTKTTLPVLKMGLSGTADQFNRMAKDMEEVINESARTGVLLTAFGAVQMAMEPLVPLPGQILNSLTKMTIAASPLLERMNQAFARWSEKMTDDLNAAFEAGTLQAAISRAGDTIVNFFRRIANNPEWIAFQARIKETGPKMSEIFGSIAEALLKIINALAPVTGAFMTLIGIFADFINAIPTDILAILITKIILLKIAIKAAMWVAGLTRALAGLKLALIAINSQAAMTSILATSSALAILGAKGKVISGLAYAIRGLARASIVLGVLWAGKEIIEHFSDAATGAAPDVDKLQIAIKGLVDTGRMTGELKKAFGDIAGISEGFKTLNKGIRENIGGWESMMGETFVSDWARKQVDAFRNGEKSIEGWTKKMNSLDDALTELVNSGHGDIAAQFIKNVGISSKDSKKYLKDYEKAVVAADLAQKLAAETMGRYGVKALEVGKKLDIQKRAAEGLRGSIEALNAAHRKAMGGEIAMEQAVDDATAALKENGKTLDINTEAGRKNKTSLLDLAQATSDAALAKLEETGSWTQANAIYSRGREQLIKLATQMGMSATEAKKFADKVLDIPDSKTVNFAADMRNLDQEIQDAQIKVDNLKQKKKTAVGADKAALAKEIKEAQAIVDGLVQKRKVTIDAWIKLLDDEIDKAQAKVDALKQKKKTAVGADKAKLTKELKKAQTELDDLKQKKKVALQAKDDTAEGIKKAQDSIDKKLPKKVQIPITLLGISQTAASDAADAIRKQAEYWEKQAAKNKRYGGVIRRAAGGPIQGFDGGGAISGPGGPTSDSILAAVSNGEFVMRASAVKKYGVGYMEMINRGMFPKFAGGGSVSGSSVSGRASAGRSELVKAVKVLADTKDIDSKVIRTQALLDQMGRKLPQPVPFTAIDRTAPAAATARANFNSVVATNKGAYTKIGQATNLFGTSLNSKMVGLRNSNLSTWQGWKSGLEGRTKTTFAQMKNQTNAFSSAHVGKLNATKNASQSQWSAYQNGMTSRTKNTYSNIKTQTNNFSASTVSGVTKTKNSSFGQWNAFQTGMTSRTSKTYSTIKKGTTTFGSDLTRSFGSTRDNVGTAWNGVRPKLASPIKYLIQKVINAGVVPAMNSVVSQLGGGSKLRNVSSAGFATGGFVSGPGGPTSDSIPARLSNGEFVMRAQAVKKYGVGMMAALNSGRSDAVEPHANGGPIGFAGGGLALVRNAGKGKLEKMLGDYGSEDYKRLAEWIWENAVDPLLEQAPGGSAMKNLVKSGGKMMQKHTASYLEANILPPMMANGFQPWKSWKAGDGNRTTYGGKAMNVRTKAMVMNAEKLARKKFSITQGSYSTSVGASAGTHAGGGVLDTNPSSDNEIGALRASGFAAWGRTRKEGFSPHAHSVAVGDPTVSPQAAAQVRSFFAGRNGLAGNGPDTYMGGLMGSVAGGVQRWTGAVQTSLREVGQSLSNTALTLRRMNQESGGNPRAVNLWDSNAKAGHPSVGLMQVIRGTFNAYAGKYKNTGPKMYGVSINPVANIFASMRYALSRYGSLASAYNRKGGYAAGGPVMGPGTGTSDSIHARLSDGEYVVRAAAVKKHGVGFMNHLNQGGMPCMAHGGAVHSGMASLATGGTTYTIKKGDTLSGIASKYKISLSSLLNANPSYKKNPNLIYPGKKLVIPGKSSGGGGSTPKPPSTAIPKAPKGDIENADAVGALQGLVTIGEVSTIANKFGVGIRNETLSGLSAQTDIHSLLGNLNETKGAITQAFKGKTQELLLKRFTDTANKLIPLQINLDKVRKSLEAAEDSLADVKGKFDGLKNSVADNIMQFGSITKIGKYGTSAGTIIGQMQKDVGKSEQFAGMLSQLKAKGVDGALIEQIAQAGITGGGMWTADSLLKASPAELAKINELQKQLTTAANTAGTAAADAAYGAGVKAAQGLVNGLKAQEKAIEAQMASLANSLIAAIKQALGIKSPSRVMAQVGNFTAMGFVQGMSEKEKEIKTAVLRIGGIPASLVPTTVPSAHNPNRDDTIGRGRVVIENLNVTVQGTFDISSPKERRKLAEALGKDIKEVIRLEDRKRI